MVQIHITQMLHDARAQEIIDFVAPIIKQIHKNHQRMSGLEMDQEEKGKLALRSLCLAEKG